MREIKFRGFHTFENKIAEWVYGYHFIVKDLGDHAIFLSNGNGSRVVDKNSTGQFTGIYDKLGVEIYEGDILGHYKNRKLFLKGLTDEAIVRWDNEDCFYYLEYYSIVGGEGFSSRYGFKGECMVMKVVGNIFENPDFITHA